MPQRSNSNELFREVSVLSQRVAAKDSFLALTSCMNVDYRNIIGAIKAFDALFDDASFEEFIKPCEILGRAGWGRTELTDLGLRLGENIRRGSLKDIDF